MEASGLEIWDATQNKYELPTTELSTWTDAKKNNCF